MFRQARPASSLCLQPVWRTEMSASLVLPPHPSSGCATLNTPGRNPIPRGAPQVQWAGARGLLREQSLLGGAMDPRDPRRLCVGHSHLEGNATSPPKK